MSATAALAGSPAGSILIDARPERTAAERARLALGSARRLWARARARALGEARRRFRVWRLEREVARMLGVLDRLDDRQLALLGLDRLTMLDVIEERLVAREFGPPVDRTLLLPAAP